MKKKKHELLDSATHDVPRGRCFNAAGVDIIFNRQCRLMIDLPADTCREIHHSPDNVVKQFRRVAVALVLRYERLFDLDRLLQNNRGNSSTSVCKLLRDWIGR